MRLWIRVQRANLARESLWGSATLGHDRMQQEQARVAHCARDAGGSDGKTSSLAVAIRSV